MLSQSQRAVAVHVAQLVHSERKKEAAIYLAELAKVTMKLDGDDPSKYLPILQNWLHWLLNNGAPFEAAQLLWTPNLFNPGPQFTQDVWKLFDEADQGMIMGASSCSKSFGMGARLFLEWIRDPEWTNVKIAGPSQDHLEANLFSAFVRMHQNASLPMPGTPGELFIGESRRNQLGSIKGIVIPLGRLKKSGRIQGSKREKRIKPHPRFGPRSRMFIFLDEVENIPEGIWDDVTNVLSQVSSDHGFKIFMAWNPVNPAHEVGKQAEPEFGWGDFDPDQHFRWRSRRGWEVLRLDGEKSENVVQGKVIYEGLQTREGLEAIARKCGGRDAAGYYTQGRGCYPKQGATTVHIPPGMFDKWRGKFIWYEDPVQVAACDLALEGGAAAEYSIGKWGLASGKIMPPSVQFPEGQVIMFKNERGQVMPRYGLQLDQQFSLSKGDTIATAEQLENLNKKTRVQPHFFSCDRTGVGAGASDVLKHNWGPGLHDVNYMEGASETKLMVEDSKTCKEEYDRAHTELWYALRAYGEYGYLLINPEMDVTELKEQVTTRQTKVGTKSRIESKKDYMLRGYKSPDKGDSLTLFVNAGRKGSGVVLSRVGDAVGGEDPDDDHWYDGVYRGGCRIDPSNSIDRI